MSIHLRCALGGELAMKDDDGVLVDFLVFAQEGMFNIGRFKQIDGSFDVPSIEFIRVSAIHDQVFTHFPAFRLQYDIGQGLCSDSGRSVVAVVHGGKQILFEDGSVDGPPFRPFQGLFDELADVFFAFFGLLWHRFRQGSDADRDSTTFHFFVVVFFLRFLYAHFPFVVGAPFQRAAEERFLDAQKRRFDVVWHGCRVSWMHSMSNRCDFRRTSVYFVLSFVAFVPPFFGIVPSCHVCHPGFHFASLLSSYPCCLGCTLPRLPTALPRLLGCT
mmetsp:Transcript_908/g.5743  ORF Transcript_908/g.5743 Transcript_908/m.5743 type:complete len:273 (+) Transcript_908:506-1324(+)